MRLAWKELTYNWKKYLLVEIIVILMMFMVLFLSGLVSGLGRAVSSGIESMDASTFVLGKDSEKLITVSSLTDAQYKNLQDEYGSRQSRTLASTPRGSSRPRRTRARASPQGRARSFSTTPSRIRASSWATPSRTRPRA